ncbi:FecCD family ABC transporter permease [Candidatus Contubernalis alkaliaceticus]|uniref:FecCD family ABC transporter permease n=1 Tax=Candidatus Contubernalis alkaliaceticus TaxID=338645 RepID=UPI001F4BED4D|nr:iron ABC transporter permease [Candidatus Contubernalis alkalaceticus]UNC93274.1 iron ABC transporter permease [Candidatus Contubernalis alkalaceticus]
MSHLESESQLIVQQRKKVLLIFFFAVTGFVIMFISINIGTLFFDLNQVISVLFGKTADTLAHQIIYNIRLPRILTGTLVGMNLALSGALLQGVLRNPLASPQIIGVNSGAGLAAVIIMIYFPGNITMIPLGAFLGAFLAATLVYCLAAMDVGSSTISIVLAGVAISAFLNAFTSGMMILNGDELEVTFSWLLGGLTGRGWSYFHIILPYSAVGLTAALFLSPRVNLFALGDEVSSSLGLPVKIYRVLVIITAAVLAGSAVSVAGTIGFVGLIAPHMARLLVGNDYRYMLVSSGMLGAVLLLLADTIARTVFQPVELPVGVITAALGAPFFLYLLYRKGGNAKI